MRATVLFCLLSVAGSASAQVTFDQALALGVEAPGARTAREALEARRDGDADIGGTAQATQVTLMPGAVLSPDQERGFDFQLNAVQGWNLGDLGGARRRAASLEREALAARVRAEALRARLGAGRRWMELRTIEALARVLAAQAETAERLVETTARGVELGVATTVDLADAQALLARIGQQRLALEGEHFAASNLLALAMGQPDAAPLRTSGPLPAPQLPPIDAIEARLASVEAMPQVLAQRLAQTAAHAREVEAAAAYAPLLQVGAQLERTSTDTWVLYGVVGFQFEAFGQGNRATSLARAEAAAAATEAEAARLAAQAELSAALHEVEHTRAQLAMIEERLLPAVITLRERRERALELGEGTIYALLEARRRELEARELRTRARGERLWAEVQMWLLLAQLEQGAEDAR